MPIFQRKSGELITDMRIALVQCPIWSVAMPPLGLASLQAWLSLLGHRVRVKDFNISLSTEDPQTYDAVRLLNLNLNVRGMFIDSLTQDLVTTPRWDLLTESAGKLQAHTEGAIRSLLELDPHVIGFSVQWNSLPLSLAYCRVIRQFVGTQPRLVLGGPACGYLQPFMQSLVDRGLLDACVIGEGEEAARVLFGEVGTDGAILSSMYSPQVMSFRNFSPPDVNGLPVPDFTGLLLDQYADHCIPVLSSRGCVARCAFCDERSLWHQYRQRDAKTVVADLISLSSRHNNKIFRFNDSLINGNMQWLHEFTDAIRDTRLEVRWLGNARVHPKMNAGLFERLQAAGCRELLFGIESGSSRVLRQMRKGTTPAMASKVIADCSRSNIRTHTYWILGSPTEEIDDLHKSLRFLQTHIHTIDSVHFHVHALSVFDSKQGNKWGDNSIRLNLPLFKSLFLHIQQTFSSSGSWLRNATDNEWDISQSAVRQAHLRHPRRLNAALLLTVIAGGLEKLERNGWHLIGNDSSFLDQTSLASKKVMLILSSIDNTEFIQQLIKSGPSFVLLHWLSDWSDTTFRQLSDMKTLLNSNGIDSGISPTQHACIRKQPNTACADGCDVCVAIKFASSGEAHKCCQLIRSGLALDWHSMDDVWHKRQEVYESFVSHLCRMRQSQECGSCLGDYNICPTSCCSGKAVDGISETIYTDWY